MKKILIETPRLYMREFTLDDEQAVFDFNSDFEVTRYTGDKVMTCLEDAKEVIQNIWLAEYEKYGYARYALIHKEDNKMIGFCGVKFVPDDGYPDIGYRLTSDYWGQGLATEAVKATLDYARNQLGLTKVFGEVVVDNIASSKVLLKCGMKLVDTYEKDGFRVNRYE